MQLLRPVTNHVKLFEVDPSSAIVEVLMFVKPVSNHVRLFRALLDCFGHLGSNKLPSCFPPLWFVILLRKFRWFYVVVDWLKLLENFSGCAL